MSAAPDGGRAEERSPQARSASEAQLRLVLDSPSVVIFSLDREYCYTSFNRSHAAVMRSIWGVEIEYGQCMLDVIGDEGDRAKAKRNFDRGLAGEEFTLIEAYGDEALKRTFYEDRYAPTLDTSGEVVGVTVLVTDVTQQVRAQEERLQLEMRMREAARLESLGVLAGGIAHDFNNLLVGILGSAELALQDTPPGSPQRESLETIELSAKRAAELTRQLLAYSGSGRYVMEVLDVGELVRETLELARALVSKKAEVTAELGEGLAVEAQDSQLRQIVMNLVLNASDALGDRGGRVHVETRLRALGAEDAATLAGGEGVEPGVYVEFEVTDDGCGMDEPTQGKIFEPFFTTKATGRGLGLSAVLGIVRGHGGYLEVTSHPGRGTRFAVGLPRVHDRPTPRRVEKGLGEVLGRGELVLAADDEESVRKVVERVLKRAGFRVQSAKDGEEVLARYAELGDEVGVVLLDMTMPGPAGTEVLAALRQKNPGLPAVLMSGYSESDFTSVLESEGPTTFLEKPFSPRELVAAVARMTRAE